MTTLKRIHVVDKKASKRCGWKSAHKRDFYMEKNVKLIALREGHPYHKIAERLYPKTDWHGSDRPVVPHRPFINIKEFHTLHQVTQIPLEEMEANVIEVRNWWAGHREIPMKFPVWANRDWAWLLGYWFASGSLITRTRTGSGKRHEGFHFEERSVRLKIDVRVFEEKLSPILSRIAYIPGATDVWYMKHGGHKLDKNRRRGVGNTPRKVIFLVRPIREIMEKFGLPTKPVLNQHDKRGGRYAARRFNLTIPDWIKESKENSHSFFEGYINGLQIGSFFHKAKGETHLSRGVELRFSGIDEQQTLDFLAFFEENLTSLGITGAFHHLPKVTSPLLWLGYHIFRHSALTKLYESFDIRRPDVRARLVLEYFMNALLYEACRELTSSEILVMGALLEKPMSTNEITDMFRFRPETVNNALEKMQTLHLVRQVNGKWRIRPTSYRKNLTKRLLKLEHMRRATIAHFSKRFFSQCDDCGNIIAQNYQGPCGCGGHYRPISRTKVLEKHRRSYMPRIHRISGLTMPATYLFWGVKNASWKSNRSPRISRKSRVHRESRNGRLHILPTERQANYLPNHRYLI